MVFSGFVHWFSGLLHAPLPGLPNAGDLQWHSASVPLQTIWSLLGASAIVSNRPFAFTTTGFSIQFIIEPFSLSLEPASLYRYVDVLGPTVFGCFGFREFINEYRYGAIGKEKQGEDDTGG